MPHFILPLLILWAAKTITKAVRVLIFGGQVVAVLDGDTIKVKRWFCKTVTVRLAEIDAPEKQQDGGEAAKQALSELLPTSSFVVLAGAKRDRYGRIVAHVYTLCGLCVNEAMVNCGQAWHYEQYSKSALLAELQAKAKKSKRGLWAKRATAPWQWRNNKK